MKRRAPKKPAQCSAVRRWEDRFYRCLDVVRSVAEVAAELRGFSVRWRASGVECWSAYPMVGDYGRQDGSAMLAAVADTELPALAIALEGKLCRRCAREEAERQGLALKLAFLGCLTGLASGRDERAEEEFNLGAVAA